MKKIYISAPIAMYRKEGKDWKKYFNDKDSHYDDLGFIVFNPVKIGTNLELLHKKLNLIPPNSADYMTECSRILYENFYENPKDGYMLMHPEYSKSVGCKCERGIAEGLGINIIYDEY
jgi:hypothetical protein